MKKLTVILLLAATLAADAGERIVRAAFIVNPVARYRTTDAKGDIECWQFMPRIIVTNGGHEFWSDETGRVLNRITGSVPPKNWKRTARRIR